jgi:ribonucleoside-diphosphate reductase alpha chain
MFDPFDVPELNNTFGDEFRAAYFAAVDAGKAKKKVKAQDLYGLIVKTLAETGNGWMCFSDACNVKNNQTGMPGNVVSSSNLCTEITEVSRRGKTPEESETAVCNLGSIVLPSYVQVEGRRRANSHDVYVRNGLEMDFAELRKHVQLYVRQLDTVIDYNFYPVESAKRSNHKWRPVGLGMMGLQDVFFRFGIAFDSPEALALSTRISEEIYFAALTASADLAEKHGPFPAFNESRTKDGVLQFDLWNVIPSSHLDWPGLKERIKKVGVRNSLLIAIAPTATIGSITGVYECIEPQVTNLLKRETLSGEFIQINKYLVSDLKKLNLWNEEIRNLIKLNDGSIQSISQIPQSLRDLYKTAWEIPQKVLIDLAAARGAFIDQSQSLNLFMASPNIGKLSSMYMYAWKQGLKTTYYLRSRPATKIAKTTVTHAINAVPQIPEYTVSQSVMCSLENPEACEACQ